MKKIFIIVILSIFYLSNAFAVTLLDALNQTYKNNIQLNAERENIKASEEDVNISKADYKHSLTLSGSKSIEDTGKLTNQTGGDAAISDVDPFTTSIISSSEVSTNMFSSIPMSPNSFSIIANFILCSVLESI